MKAKTDERISLESQDSEVAGGRAEGGGEVFEAIPVTEATSMFKAGEGGMKPKFEEDIHMDMDIESTINYLKDVEKKHA